MKTHPVRQNMALINMTLGDPLLRICEVCCWENISADGKHVHSRLFSGLKVSIYLQNMSIKRRLSRFDQMFFLTFSLLFCGQLVSQHNWLCMPQFPKCMRNDTDVYSSAWDRTVNASINSTHFHCDIVSESQKKLKKSKIILFYL
jgi:hypothetical protein